MLEVSIQVDVDQAPRRKELVQCCTSPTVSVSPSLRKGNTTSRILLLPECQHQDVPEVVKGGDVDLLGPFFSIVFISVSTS